jgi:uncharacterized protein YllA (UPF0747 family)
LNVAELPGFPKIWVDFVNSRLPFLPASHVLHSLPAKVEAIRNQAVRPHDLLEFLSNGIDLRSGATQANLQRLRQSDSMVVVANLYPGLFGGSAFQLLKCVTAIKVCDELKQRAITAVPVCWIHADPPCDVTASSIQVLDSQSELHRVQLPQSSREVSDLLFSSQISPLIKLIEELGHGSFDPEVIEILEASFKPDVSLTQATALLITALTEEWGMVVLNPGAPELRSYLETAQKPLQPQVGIIKAQVQNKKDEPALAGNVDQISEDTCLAYLVQSSVMPVIACVLDPCEAYSFFAVQPVFDQVGLTSPLPWPQASATLMDVRSRRTLERYSLDLRRLYSGEKAILNDFQSAMPRAASGKLENLKNEAEARIDGVRAFDSNGKKLRRATDSGRERIVFQIDKLRNRLDAASDRKLQTASRQIHKACNSLAPNRRRQELELAGIQMLLRYSRAVLRLLHEKLDILNLEHQIILMD